MNISELKSMKEEGYTHLVVSGWSLRLVSKHKSMSEASTACSKISDYVKVLDVNSILEEIEYSEYLEYRDEVNEDRDYY